MTIIDDKFDADALHSLIQPTFEEIVSRSRSLDPLIDSLAMLTRPQQNRVLHWVEVIARTNAELAYQFASFAPRAFEQLALRDVDDWVLCAMNIYDHQGLFAAISELAQIERFIAERKIHGQAVSLVSISNILKTFVQGLNGRHLAIEAAEQNWTDTETIYLPKVIAEFGDRDKNFRLFKATVSLLWAQSFYGTFALTDEGKLKLGALADYEDFDKAKAIFQFLETERLLFRIETELPGLARQMREVAGAQEPGLRWQKEIQLLSNEETTVDDSLAAVTRLYPSAAPSPAIFQGELLLPVTEKTIHTRIAREREQLQQALASLSLLTASDQQEQQATESPTENEPLRVTLPGQSDNSMASFELSFRGRTVTPSPDIQKLLQSILQDLGDIPLDYLVAGGSADPSSMHAAQVDISQSDEEVTSGQPYPEWDFRRGHYRQDWCYLNEVDINEGADDFVDATLKKYATTLPQLRKSFEALRGEDKWLRRQLDGDDIDLDALVAALADVQTGRELSDHVYTRLSRIDRNIAVMFMIDMSGSTKGWVNDAERESLVLLCQALEILGDQYAIYGFSGMTRKRCELYRIKQFDEPYSETIERRISGISAKDYTRMGVTIRHLNKTLETIAAKTKLLITLSDGKPEDFDGYGGEYGIEDTRQALIESRRLGIHPFCITIDTEASSYLPHMYGAHSYAVVDDVRTLPLRVADVYRRLTL